MIVIIEGVDGAGKTTLVDALIAAHDGPSRVIKRSQLREDPMVAYEWRDLSEYDGSTLFVCDRWHVGELVYGPLYRGRSMLEPAQTLHIEMALTALGALRLHVTAPIDVIMQRVAERGEEFLQPKHFGLVWDFYRHYVTTPLGRRWQTIDSSEPYRPAEILRRARRASAAARGLAVAPSYVGPVRPDVLVVTSSRRRTRGLPDFRFAATPTISDPRALAIMRQIEASHHSVGVTTVCEGVDVRGQWERLERPRVIATDYASQHAAELAEVPHSIVSTHSIQRAIDHPEETR